MRQVSMGLVGDADGKEKTDVMVEVGYISPFWHFLERDDWSVASTVRDGDGINRKRGKCRNAR